ncbi:MAG: DNA mismatch repair protein MutS [Pirellulales bacterium]|nr:DNA mismatch repair protein MutS [Pirellulales bacterium]
MATPMMQQFEAAKARCPGALVLFRMGDFYELFGDDAREAAELLDLTVTSREKGPDAMPMAGFPHHQLDPQLVKLVAAGRRVAICEQIDDPKTTKGLLRREVTRIVTPGIAADESLLDPTRSNFLVAVIPVETGQEPRASPASPSSDSPQAAAAGIAWIDVAGGRFQAAVLPPADLAEHLQRLDPAECLCDERDHETVSQLLRSAGLHAAVTARPSWWFATDRGPEELSRKLGGVSLEGLGFEPAHDAAGLAAAHAVISYLAETEPAAIGRIGQLKPWRSGHAMEIDEATRRTLELVRTVSEGRRAGSLAGVLDRTKTPMGARMLSRWLVAPLIDPAAIDRRLDAVGMLVDNASLAGELADTLSGIGDLERITSRVVSGRAGPRDGERIGQVARVLPRLRSLLEPVGPGLLADCCDSLDPCDDIASRITQTLREGCPAYTRDGGFIRPGFDASLDELVELASGGKEWITRYQAEQVERTGLTSLKVGFNRVFGFYLEVSKSQSDRVPADYLRKQTVKNAERYTTPELDERQRQVLGAEDAAVRRECELFEQLRDFLAGEHRRLDRTADLLAMLDVLVSMATVARQRGWCRPEITERRELELVDGRHPVLEELLPVGTLVANDLQLAADSADGPQLLLVTGPNMGGKSTYIRQAALAVVLAQAGSWVPAARARVGIVDRLFARIGAGDDLARGASTFLVEMAQTARILNRATPQSLVILDEVGRGTSTFDGMALAQSVVEHLHDEIGCRTLFATHYLQLAVLERLPGVMNVQVLVQQHGDHLAFLHKVARGAADRSWGIHVAKLAGVPDDVIARATTLLASLEADPPPPRPSGRKAKATTDDTQLPLFGNERPPHPH